MTERGRASASTISKGGQDDVGQLAGAEGGGSEVAAGAGGGVAGEVLEGGDDARGLQAAHVADAHRAHEVGVLAEGLLGASPAVVACDVEDGGEALVDAGGAHLGPEVRAHALHEPGVEGGGHGERGGVYGGAPGGEAGEALLVDLGGDAEA